MKRTILIPAILLGAVLLSGCVHTSAKALNRDTAVISSVGALGTSSASVIAKTLFVAAKVTLSKGYRYFAVVNAKDATRTGTAYFPGQTYSSGTVSGSGNLATYSGTSFTTPGTALALVYPGTDIVIKMYHEGEIEPGTAGVWDAMEVFTASSRKKPPPHY